jgi:hypothetical protein
VRANATTTEALVATPLPAANKRIAAPGHAWSKGARWPLRCEGITPISGSAFAPGHSESIAAGQPYLRKRWRTAEGAEFCTRHCSSCGLEIEKRFEWVLPTDPVLRVSLDLDR